jgi:hypothetical protein
VLSSDVIRGIEFLSFPQKGIGFLPENPVFFLSLAFFACRCWRGARRLWYNRLPGGKHGMIAAGGSGGF